MDEKELKENFQNCINELVKYKDFTNSELDGNKDFASLILNINKLINSNENIKNKFNEKQNYYKEIESEMNILGREIVDEFKEQFKNINVEALEKAKQDATNNPSFLCSVDEEKFYKHILCGMNVISYEQAYFINGDISANDFKEILLKHVIEYKESMFFEDENRSYLEKIKNFNLSRLMSAFHGKLNLSGNEDEIEEGTYLNKIEELLVSNPRIKNINNFIIMQTLILYFTTKGTSLFRNKTPNYYWLYHNQIIKNKENYIQNLGQVLENLKLSIKISETKNEEFKTASKIKNEIIAAFNGFTLYSNRELCFKDKKIKLKDLPTTQICQWVLNNDKKTLTRKIIESITVNSVEGTQNAMLTDIRNAFKALTNNDKDVLFSNGQNKGWTVNIY